MTGPGGTRGKSSRELPEHRHPRLQDVADEAGVSVTTVSVVLSGVPNSGIPAPTQERVRAAARQLGYVPNFSAQSLRTKRSRTLGLITDGVASSPFAGDMVAGAQAAAWKRGYVLLIVDTGDIEELAESAALVLLQRRVEHVIIASWFHRLVDVPQSLRAHNPVLANCFSRDEAYAAIVPDEEDGGYAATRRLLQRERAKVGLVGFHLTVPAGPLRLKGYKRALREAGVPYDRSIVSTRAYEKLENFPVAQLGYEDTNDILDRNPDVRLLFCWNDRAAMGAYEAIKAKGLRIPQDIAVVGFDNQEVIASELMPGLTTVALPHYAMGERAVERALMAQSSKRPQRPKIELAPCLLVERQSV